MSMTPADLRSARKRLGLTQHGLAEALRMGAHGWQSISRWEKDGGTVPGPAQVAVESLLLSANGRGTKANQIGAPPAKPLKD